MYKTSLFPVHFRYPLLLSRICKATPRRNTDREKLKMAQRKIEEQLNKINAVSNYNNCSADNRLSIFNTFHFPVV